MYARETDRGSTPTWCGMGGAYCISNDISSCNSESQQLLDYFTIGLFMNFFS